MSQELKLEIVKFFNGLEGPQQIEFLDWLNRLDGVFIQTEQEINKVRERLKPILNGRPTVTHLNKDAV